MEFSLYSFKIAFTKRLVVYHFVESAALSSVDHDKRKPPAKSAPLGTLDSVEREAMVSCGYEQDLAPALQPCVLVRIPHSPGLDSQRLASFQRATSPE